MMLNSLAERKAQNGGGKRGTSQELITIMTRTPRPRTNQEKAFLAKYKWELVIQDTQRKISEYATVVTLDQRSCDSIGYEFVIENDASKDALEMLIIHSFIVYLVKQVKLKGS